MRLTDEMIQEDDKRFKRQDLLAEFNYCGKEVPKRNSITNDDIRFYAWLCRSAVVLLKEWEPVKPNGTRKAMSFAFNGMLTGYCPRCGTIVNSVGNSGACGKCGQKLDWE